MFMKEINQMFPSFQSQVMLFVGIAMVLLMARKMSKTLVLALSVAINAYIINCLVYGDCNKIAWFYVVMNLLATYYMVTDKL
jgi:hypothetical protein